MLHGKLLSRTAPQRWQQLPCHFDSTQEMVKWIKKNHPNVQADLEKTRHTTRRYAKIIMEISPVIYTYLNQSDLGDGFLQHTFLDTPLLRYVAFLS